MLGKELTDLEIFVEVVEAPRPNPPQALPIFADKTIPSPRRPSPGCISEACIMKNCSQLRTPQQAFPA